jgi:hypothetical protein
VLNLQIEDARVIMDKENPFRSRGFGFVTFSRPGSVSSSTSCLEFQIFINTDSLHFT